MSHTLQRGLSTLVVVLGLFFVSALAAAYANRHVLVELRIARLVSDDLRAQAAAEHGLEQALMLLNRGAIDAGCQAVAQGGRPARERWLRTDDRGLWERRTAPAQGAQLVCDRSLDGEWQCACADEQALPGRPNGAVASSSVRVALAGAVERPGHLWLNAQGCAQASEGCPSPDAATPPGTGSHRRLQLAHLPALRQVPSSALLATGSVDLGDGMAVVNTDAAAGGMALRAGGPLSGQRDAVIGPNGALPAESALDHDGALSGLGAAGLMRRLLGLPLDELSRHPALHRLRCEAACDAAVVTALLDRGARFIWIEGPLRLDREVHWGQPDRPVLLVVGGDLAWTAPSRLTGALLVQGDARLSGGSGQARFDGAVVVGGRVQGEASAQLVHRADVLHRLQHTVGSFLRVPGSGGGAS